MSAAPLPIAPHTGRDARPAPPPRIDFEDLVRRFGPRLLAVARRLLRSEDDARDAVQDALLSAFRSMDRFEGHAAPETWLHRIVVNTALMKLRSRKRKPETAIEDLLPGFLEDGHHERHVHDWPECPERQLGRRETQAIVRACIDQLPEAHRTILVLRDIEELSTEEAAVALGISAGAAKLRLHRARQALRGLLSRFFERGQA
jgi:RNA polymerase sigma-70 factor, ECF subfamily